MQIDRFCRRYAN